ncbi:hypothetical protein MKW92_015842 [Papaver armeniacum]|nr:hypothetical protein MKW92_015842 [Papaver armeniacum]
MNEEICSSTANSDNSDQRRRQHYRLNARRRLSNLTAEERSRWLARRNESQRERRRARQHQLCGPAETGRQIRLHIQTSELERQHKSRQQSANGVGQSTTNVVRLSSIRRLARIHRSPTAEIVEQAEEFEFVEEIEFANENEVFNDPAQRRRRTTFRYQLCKKFLRL